MAERSTFVKIDRNIMRWRWYKHANTLQLFLHLIISANVSDHDFEDITIRRGQLATSYPSLSNSLGMTIQQVRTALGHLKSTGEVTVTKYPKFSVITVVSYDEYQRSTAKSTGSQQASNRQATGDQHQYKNVRKYPTDTKKEKKGGAASEWPPAPGTPEYERLINQ